MSTPLPSTPEQSQVEFTILTPSLAPEQLAAVTAALRHTLSSDVSAPTPGPAPAPAPSGWDVSRRNVNRDVRPGPGAWQRG